MLGITFPAIVAVATPPRVPIVTPLGTGVDLSADIATLNPVRQFSSAKKRKEAGFSDPGACTAYLNQFQRYWKDFIASEPCHSPGYPTKTNKCKCKTKGCLASDANAKAGACLMLHYAQMNHEERNNYLIDSIKKADSLASSGMLKGGKKHTYWLPGLKTSSGKPVYVCKGTFCQVLGVGRTKLAGISSWMDKHEDDPLKRYEHGLKGKTSNRAKEVRYAGAKERATLFLQHVHDTEREERATRFVRTIAGLSTRDDDKSICELPSHMSKRRYYGRHCFEQGLVLKVDDKGNYGAMNDFEVRKDWEDDGRSPNHVS